MFLYTLTMEFLIIYSVQLAPKYPAGQALS